MKAIKKGAAHTENQLHFKGDQHVKRQWHQPTFRELDVRMTATMGLLSSKPSDDDDQFTLYSKDKKKKKSGHPHHPHGCW